MQKSLNQNYSKESNLYNTILLLSRNKIFYTNFGLSDTFQNRIHLIFIHISFLFIKSKRNNENQKFKDFKQNLFDLTFNKIEQNMREIGYGDVTVNKNMKFLVKNFYNILLKCEDYKKNDKSSKITFFFKFLTYDKNEKTFNNIDLIEYFDKYERFCIDLNPDSVLKGNLYFNYK
jgi:cytochrome b pre-mRNA-processing protein 3